ncbi:hypothetical protein DD592_26445, partial [Enterobacter cloacae complex sp. 2DZ2F20B]
MHKMTVTKGGGVLLACRREFALQPIDLTSKGYNSLRYSELLAVKCSINYFNIYVVVIYVQPKATIEEFELIFHILANITESNNHNVLIVGDFNLPDYSSNLSLPVTSNRKISSLFNFLNFCNYKQYNNVNNINERCLDLVIGSFYCSVDKCDDSLVDEDVHHPSLIISKTQRGKKTNSISHSGIVNAHWNFRQADYPNLYKEIMKINWTELNSISDINIASGIFYDK